MQVTAAPASLEKDAAPIFVDRALATGLDFRHVNGMSGQRYMVEMVGAGSALFDYDRDGDLDVYLLQGHPLIEGASGSGADAEHRDRLYRNDLTVDAEGRPELRFTDVTDDVGLDARGYGMGVAAGDVNNDGWTDLYVTNWGPNQLWINEGGTAFRLATEAVDNPVDAWSTSAAFLDYDRDGWLDLYVVNYLNYSLSQDIPCPSAKSGAPSYCGPSVYRPRADVLLHNRGDGSFEDVSLVTGIAAASGPGLGVIVSDFDGDGRDDVYVANDGADNFLWMAVDGGRFEDRARAMGSAVNRDGQPEASMGVVAADFDADGDEDLFMTHLAGEKNTLYRNDGLGRFRDETRGSGLDTASLAYTAFGIGVLDFDNDGWLDLAIANGDVKTIDEQAAAGDPLPLRQANQLFRNLGGGTFEDVTTEAGASFGRLDVSRGIATGDVDNDGDADLLLSNNNGPVELLINQRGEQAAWLGFDLRLGETGREAYGAVVDLMAGDQVAARRQVRADGSYCTSNDPRLLFGLGEGSAVEAIRVRWPDGSLEVWPALENRRYHRLIQGQGETVP